MFMGHRLSELLQGPLRSGVSSHVAVENKTAADFYCEERYRPLETGRHCHWEITCDDPCGMILDEGSPTLRRVSRPGPIRLLRPVLANGSRRNEYAQL